VAHRQHRIAEYQYGLEAGSGYGRLSLWDEHGRLVGEIGFLEAGRSLPAPRLAQDLGHGAGFMPIERLVPLVDMLRNEQPVFLKLDDQAPGYLTLATGKPLSAGVEDDA
jgi:hypothetical protein